MIYQEEIKVRIIRKFFIGKCVYMFRPFSYEKIRRGMIKDVSRDYTIDVQFTHEYGATITISDIYWIKEMNETDGILFKLQNNL
jgi:hypothetical protein